jgi:hypothetical protein
MTRVRQEMSQEQKHAVAIGAAFAQLTFAKLYPGGVESFVDQRAKVQEHFINMLEASASDAIKFNGLKVGGKGFGQEMAIGIRLQNMYFTALLPVSHKEWRTDAVHGMIDRLADELRPLNKEGFIALAAT